MSTLFSFFKYKFKQLKNNFLHIKKQSSTNLHTKKTISYTVRNKNNPK